MTKMSDLREKVELTQQNVADIVGITRSYYNMIENGKRGAGMPISLALKIAEALKCDIRDIVDE